MNNYTEYTVESAENKRIIIITDIHNCHFEWHDTKNEDRMELMCEMLEKEYGIKNFDAILALGDYSLDYWKWNEKGSYMWDPPVSRTDEFMKKYYTRFPAKTYIIPGNHELYSNEEWIYFTGFPREYSVVYGNYVFVMLDTFAGDLAPKEHSDGVYSGINVELVKDVLARHPDKKVILCTHDLVVSKESEETAELIRNEKRIICAFAGHTHKDNTVILPDAWRNMCVFYCGDFSYNGGRQKEKNWGYRILDFNGESLSTEYKRI